MTTRLGEGKVPWDLIADKVRSHLPPSVLVGPAAGEDAALVDIGGQRWAIASDPVSFTAHDAGRLAVLVNANDVAVMGATPQLFLATVLLAPSEASPERVGALLDQIQTACCSVGAVLIGGHTEVTPGLSHSIVVGTMLGPLADRPFSTAGLRVGDRVGITKWGGLEGTSILLAEFGDRLASVLGPDDPRVQWQATCPGEWLSVVPDASVAATNSAVRALHDVTEGGVGEALYEMARASGVYVEVEAGAVPFLPATRVLCAQLHLDPLGLIGSGSLLVGCAPEGVSALESAYARAGIPFAWLGRATPPRDGQWTNLPRFPRDEVLKAHLLDGVDAYLFDMDGTLVDSDYDWHDIRAQLGVGRAPIIDTLNGLDSPERERKWGILRAIEERQTRAARAMPCARELLQLLRERGKRTALVTNNSAANTDHLIERLDLAFDAVLSRDAGAWKPSGAPLHLAMARLGVAPDRVAVVGDSRYDVEAGREAGCARICLLGDAPGSEAWEVDLRFPELTAFFRYLQVVL